ncbi:MAG: AAA domain-containing protein [Bacilli bacterium]
MIDGIDTRVLISSGLYKLDDKQFNTLLDKVFKKPKYEAEIINRYQTLAINKFSIDMNDKQYVVAYRTLTLNFKNKTLKIADKSSINKSFLITEEKKVTLGMYLDMDPDVFCDHFDENENEYIELIKENFHSNETVNTRPSVFFLMRNSQHGVDQAFESIHQMDKENKLSIPLKAFFGRNKSRSGTSKEVNLVVFDRNKINIDQMRVVYNSMINHVTYVKGPPGTGKTETIFNVLLSAYANNKTVLVCSNNNHPVGDIYKKMENFLTIKRNYQSEESIIFPMIRLGNNLEMEETIKKLREIIQFVSKHEKSRAQEELTEASKNKSLSGFKELRNLLMEYESQIDLWDRIQTLEKIRKLTTINQINTKLDDQIGLYQLKLKNAKVIKDEDVLKYAVSASEDRNFQNYVYYSSLLKFKKLSAESYRELRDIIAIDDLSEGVKQLNKYLRNDANLKRLLAVFPIVICTNLSCDKLGSPKAQFDLTIMDESAQCNIATSLIPIVRANDLLLVGDTNQLQPVTVIEQNVNEDLLLRYGVKDEYNYVHNSILSTMMRKDNNSKSILLRYHYRCGKKIAEFVNQRFYSEQLKLINKNDGELTYYNVQNTFNPHARNSYKEEAAQIVKIIKENKYKDVGIVTPFVNQVMLINDYLMRAGINDVRAGTIHTLQGSEKSVIIMSAALSPKTGKKTMEWIKNNHELINVAVTRAKNKLIFVGDKEAIDKLSGNEANDIKVLSDYVYKNGEAIVPKSDAVISYDFSNDSKNEKDFFETIKPYFNRRGSKFRIERNVPVKTAIKSNNQDDIKLFGKKEFDVVVQVSGGVFNNHFKTIVVFEIDGGEHIGSKQVADYDRQKEGICAKYGIKLIRIPNSAVKDYESIISLFEYVVKDLPNIEEAYSQINLFDE